jgi:hypothetical protein
MPWRILQYTVAADQQNKKYQIHHTDRLLNLKTSDFKHGSGYN